MLAESGRRTDKIKFLEKNNCLHRYIKLHDAGWRFQLVVPWSVRPHQVCFFWNYLNFSNPARIKWHRGDK